MAWGSVSVIHSGSPVPEDTEDRQRWDTSAACSAKRKRRRRGPRRDPRNARLFALPSSSPVQQNRAERCQ